MKKIFLNILENCQEKTWKGLRSATLLKTDSDTGAFL